MLTIEILREFGADVDSGLHHCLNNEAFYLNIVEKSLSDPTFDDLARALNKGDTDAAFEAAHALKGVMGYLALSPIYQPLTEITDLLRTKTESDYSGLKDRILSKRNELRKLCSDHL